MNKVIQGIARVMASLVLAITVSGPLHAQSDPAAIASYAYRSSLQSAQSIQVNASLSPVMDGHDKGSFELAGSVALIVAFTVLIILMLRKKKAY